MNHGKTICMDCKTILFECSCSFFHKDIHQVVCHHCSEYSKMMDNPEVQEAIRKAIDEQ